MVSEEKLIAATRIGYEMGFRDGMAFYANTLEAIRRVDEGNYLTLVQLEKELKDQDDAQNT